MYIYIYIRACVCIEFLAWMDARVSVRIKLSRLSSRILMLSRFKERGGVSRFRNAWLICALTSSGSPWTPHESNLHLADDATPFSNFEIILFKIYADNVIPFRICIAIGRCFSIRDLSLMKRRRGVEVSIRKKKDQSLDGNVDYNIVTKYSLIYIYNEIFMWKIRNNYFIANIRND